MIKVKIKTIKIFLLSFFLLGIFNVPLICSAEAEIEVQESQINYDTIPVNPEPYKDVTINLSSYATDLSKAIITWQLGTAPLVSEIGKTVFSFKTRGPNDPIIINVTIRPVGSMSTIAKKITVIPNEIELMWESFDGYTPPFYRGKTLPISGGYVKIVAIPNTNTIKSGSGSVSYSWMNNDKTDQEASGYNKNYYLFKNSNFDTKNTISVIASSVGGNYQAENTIEVPFYKPKILFYKKSPSEGILYNNSLKNDALVNEEEITLVAEPFYMPINKQNEKDLSFLWKINSEDVTTPSKKTEITVRPSSRGGYATIDLTIENVVELFQTVTNQLKLNL